MPYAILRTTKIKTGGNIAASLSHNYRDRETHNADETKAHLNSHDHDSKDAAFEAIQNRLPVKIRKNGVHCIEYMITASPDFFEDNNHLTHDKYFESAKEWLIERHGVENVITTSIHRDETSPHLIAYVVPYVFNDKKHMENLNCKYFLGGRNTLSDMQTNFHKHVAHFGLERGVIRSVAQHQTIKEFYSKIQNPTKQLKEIASSLIIPTPTFLESKEKYGERVANDIWEQACDNFENSILKTTNKKYIQLENENNILLKQVEKFKFSDKITKKEIEKLTNNIVMAKKINQLPTENVIKIKNYVNSILEKEELKKSNIMKSVNTISFKWDCDNYNYKIFINSQPVNNKIPIWFIKELQKNKFLCNYTTTEIYSGSLPHKNNGIIPCSFTINEQGSKIDIVKSNHNNLTL